MESPYAEEIARLEKVLGRTVFVVGNSVERSFEPDHEAVRVFAELAHQRSELGQKHSKAAVLVVGEGGLPCFAEGVARSLLAFWKGFDVIVATRTRGTASLLAIKAERVLLHPLGGIGACDAGPILPGNARIQPQLWDDIPAMGGVDISHEYGLPGRLSWHRHQCRMGRMLAERWGNQLSERTGKDLTKGILNGLSQYELGTSLSLGVEELKGLGLDAALLTPSAQTLVWQLFRQFEGELELLRTPAPRYSASDLGDEVEFEPAMQWVAGAIESTIARANYEVDSGSPHPESGVLKGEWFFEKMRG